MSVVLNKYFQKNINAKIKIPGTPPGPLKKKARADQF
jgi:hypothetical protein